MRLRAHLLVSAALVVAFSCGKSEPDPTPQPSPQPQPPTPSVVAVESVALNKTELNLEPGGTETLTATVKPDNVTDKTVTWSTSNAEVATVAKGKVTAVKEGEATITAKAGEKSATCKLTVKKSVVAVESVTLNKTELSLEPGGTETLTATVKPDNATDKTVTWSTSNAEVATVTDGKVTAIKEGEATITAKAGEKSATCKVTVKIGVIPVESVTLDKTSITLEEDQGTLLTATVLPENATDKTVTWSTSNAEVATVNEGRVITIHEGEAIITAQAGDKSATCKVTVKKAVVAVSSITLNKVELSLTKGQSEVLVATVLPENATDKTVTWSSSDATIASITQDGQVTALKSGKADITAKAGEKSATCAVTVTTPVESVSLDRASVSLEVGQSTTLVATISPNDADEQKVEWSTSDATIATVTNGVVTAVAEGNATITAKVGEKSATCAVSVKNSVVVVTSVTLNKSSLSLVKGQNERLTATVNPENATDKTVTWSSSDATIASITQDGQVTALKSGKADITAKAGEKSATCAVTVTTPVESVSLDRASVSLEVGQSTTLVTTISPNDADEQKVEWSTSDATIATVTNGVVTAVAEGNATITAKVGGKSATCAVSVKNSVVVVTSVTLNKSSLSLVKGQNERLTATVNPENATDKTVTWSSSDATIASITQDGQVTALKSGKAVITAKAGEKSATCEVTITTPVVSVSLDRSSISLEEGQTTTLIATISPNDADEKTVEWTTSNASVATVAGGVVTAVAEGNATITAKVGGKSASCSVTVVKPVIHVTSVTLNKYSVNLSVGQTEQLMATVLPENATDKTVTWQSYDTSIATVRDGLVTAVSEGEVRITASCDGVTSMYCWVNVHGEVVQVTSVTLNKNTLELKPGQTEHLYVTVLPGNATDRTVTWSTSDASVATVSDGLVTAVDAGTAYIYASAGGHSASCQVTVPEIHIGETDWTKLDFYHNSLIFKFTSVYCGYSEMMTKSLRLIKSKYGGNVESISFYSPYGKLENVMCIEGIEYLINQYLIEAYPLSVMDGRRYLNNWADASYSLSLFKDHYSEQLYYYSPVTGVSFQSSKNGRSLTVEGTVYSHLAGDYLISVFLLEDYVKISDYYSVKNETDFNVVKMAVSNIKGDKITIPQDNSTADFYYSVQIPDDVTDDDLSIIVLVSSKYGSKPILRSGNFGDYYFDNCVKAKVGDNVPLRMENYLSDTGNEGITIGDDITF